MKIFLTGATGFVGHHVAQYLIGNGHKVTGLIRKKEESEELEKAGIIPQIGDIQDLDLLREISKKHDGIFHGAAASFPEWDQINYKAIEVMLHSIKGGDKSFSMQAGTMVFGDTGKEEKSEDQVVFNPPPPLQARVEIENLVLSSIGEGVKSSIVYASYVYGGEGAVLPSTMKKVALEKGYSAYIGEGDNIWSTVHIRDWARLLGLALEHKNARGKYFASTKTHSIYTIANSIGKSLELEERSRSIPIEDAEGLWGFFTQPLAFMNQAFSPLKAKREMNWISEFDLKDL